MTTDVRVALLCADDEVTAAVAATVERAGFVAWPSPSASAALAAFHPALPSAPAAVVVDVGLREPYVFEFVGSLRALPTDRPAYVVTVGSVHNPARYRRRPTSQHGADAHVDLPAVATELPRLLVLSGLPGPRGPHGRPELSVPAQLSAWAVEHRIEIGSALVSEGGLASVGGAARAALLALRARCAAEVDGELDGQLARLETALIAARAAGRPFG
jgi:hypothetical protein